MANIKITLTKSLIARKPAQIATAKSFGFRRPGDYVVVADNEAVQGKIKAISHLVKVETV
jgi:large subunit ribosomal protein L30